MNGLTGKRIIVAGAATGIGAAAARRLAAEGANVVVGDINEDGANATAARITAGGGTAVAVAFDLADEASVLRLVNAAHENFGGVDGLFNVGADLSPHNLGRDTTILETPDEVWQRTLNVNLLGYVRTIRAVLPAFLAQGGGAIVNTSSGGSFGGDPHHVAYNAVKAGLNNLTWHVAMNYGKQGVRSNALAPGLVMGETQLAQNDQAMQAGALQTALSPRLGRPEDLAATAAFLFSDDAAWINGQVWSVNGGMMLRD